MAEPRQQRARQQRVDLVVLGDQDAERLGDCHGALARGSELRAAAAGAVEGWRADELGLERGRADGLHQIAGKAASPRP